LEVMQPAQIRIALQALQELERRDQAVLRQWQMRVERAGYEAQLAQKRYEEVDPSNRLVAATLERRWNEALLRLEEVNKQYAEFQQREALAATAEQKAQVLALANDFPRLWKASTTKPQDRKRMLRLLIKDITVEKISGREQVILHIRWQGGACEDLPVELPPSMADQVRYSQDLIEKIRELARKLPDDQIAAQLNREGHVSAKGKSFTVSMVRWVRYRYQIPSPQLKRPEELTVQQVAKCPSERRLLLDREGSDRCTAPQPGNTLLDHPRRDQRTRAFRVGPQVLQDPATSTGKIPRACCQECSMKLPSPRWKIKSSSVPSSRC
jgi:hypothetical protein